ncbi:DUF4430 domain-containing protein [Pseudogracilibacillus sp. SO30301A]|uniref:DUF4430 domain-containing protein n=1 Tax=Pseudogracilibacillus sp. SO30301A TaxID=3098291 RepID=UPI00300E6C72
MKKLISKLKHLALKQQTYFKVIIAFIIVSFFTTYFGLAIYQQDVLPPENPLEEPAENSSKIPLMGGYQELVHAAEEPNDGNEEEKNQDKEQKDVTKSKAEKEKKGELHKDATKDGEHSNGLGGGTKSDPDSSNIEVTDDDSLVENEYFITSIKDWEVVTEEKYSFSIEQLDHHFDVQDVHVSINSPQASIESITEDYNKPVFVHATLAEGNNKIKVSVTYEDKDGVSFTVFRSYLVIFNKEDIIITTDLDDKKVKRETLQFKANAELAGDSVPIVVSLNEVEVEEKKKSQYEVNLQEGKNEIVISAKYKGKAAQETYTVYYEKPNLSIKTDLENKTVDDPNFSFTAEAFDGDEKINVTIRHNDKVIEENAAGTYAVTLIEGENEFNLVAKKGVETLSETYIVTYLSRTTDTEDEDEDEEDEEIDEKAPTIEIFDIKDGQTLKGSTKTFHVRGTTYDGKSITAGNGKINATNNGTNIKIDWPDSDQISFTLEVQNGENNIVITALDNEGNQATRQLTVYGDITDGVIGTVTISLEATTIGLGYIIPPEQVEIYQGDRGSHVIDRLFEKHGINYDYTGSHENSFYLSAIYRPGLVTNPVIPDDLAELVERDMSRFEPDDYLTDSLGEFDFSSGSGWMYSVDGNYPNVGFADYYFEDGQAVRIRFTLAYGADIGGGMPGTNYGKEW